MLIKSIQTRTARWTLRNGVMSLLVSSRLTPMLVVAPARDWHHTLTKYIRPVVFRFRVDLITNNDVNDKCAANRRRNRAEISPPDVTIVVVMLVCCSEEHRVVVVILVVAMVLVVVSVLVAVAPATAQICPHETWTKRKRQRGKNAATSVMMVGYSSSSIPSILLVHESSPLKVFATHITGQTIEATGSSVTCIGRCRH